jgi:two-component system nitrogen regulation response regulator NtrX
LKRLRAHAWPGNVRELANAIERLTILGGADAVNGSEVDAILPTDQPDRPAVVEGTSLNASLERYERDLIRQALVSANGNVAEAARLLATDRANLYRRMRRLGLSRSDTDACQ